MSTHTNGTPPLAVDALPPRTVAFTIRIREAEARKLHEFARALDRSPTGFATELLHSAIQGIIIAPTKARAEQTTIDELLARPAAKRERTAKAHLRKPKTKKAAKRAPKKK